MATPKPQIHTTRTEYHRAHSVPRSALHCWAPQGDRIKVTRELFYRASCLDDPDLDPAVVVETSNFEKVQRERLALAFGNLDDRSREIMQRRWLSEKKATLHELADYYEISAERVRQLEQNALKKLRLSFA